MTNHLNPLSSRNISKDGLGLVGRWVTLDGTPTLGHAHLPSSPRQATPSFQDATLFVEEHLFEPLVEGIHILNLPRGRGEGSCVWVKRDVLAYGRLLLKHSQRRSI